MSSRKKSIDKTYRSIVAFEAIPQGPTDRTPSPLFEIGVFIFHDAPIESGTKYRKVVKESLRGFLRMRDWDEATFSDKFSPQKREDVYHMSLNEVVDSDEIPHGVKKGKAYRYMFWYDIFGRVKAVGDDGRPMTTTKYDEDWFKSEVGLDDE